MPAAYRRHARPGAKMGDDELALRGGRGESGQLFEDVLVRQPMEAVTPHAFLCEAARQGGEDLLLADTLEVAGGEELVASIQPIERSLYAGGTAVDGEDKRSRHEAVPRKAIRSRDTCCWWSIRLPPGRRKTSR